MSNEKYTNLPGVKVSYEDGNLYSGNHNLQTNTQSVLLVGSAIDGPVGVPVTVAQLGGPKAAEKLFGGVLQKQLIETGELDPVTGAKMTATVKVPHQGSLVRGMYEVLGAGNEDVRMLRIAGKKAKTELEAQDLAQELIQKLGLAKGNISFSKSLTITSGRLTTDPIEYVREINSLGNIVNEYTGTSIANVVLNVDITAGSETIYFAENVFRPGNTVEVKYAYSQRTYYSVLRTDVNGQLTQSATNTHLYTAPKVMWSDDVMAGHSVNIYVDGVGIASTNTSGQALYVVDYLNGQVTFTSAYDTEVTNGVYPALTTTAKVAADYYYYDETAMTGIESWLAPGADTTYVLDHMPTSDGFKVYFDQNGIRYELAPKTAENPNGQYSMVYPTPGTTEKVKVIVVAGAVPIGLVIYASYKTKEKSASMPKLIVEGRNAGTIYGGLRNVYMVESLYGVAVDVREDITATDASGYEKIITFYKPEEKMMTSKDVLIEYSTRALPGVRTLREFANFVNNDARNNIVSLSVPDEALDVPVQGLLPTGRAINLGEFKNPATGAYELLIDGSKGMNDPARFPWLGDNGFFDKNDMKQMKALYEALGGKYQAVEGTIDTFELVEQGVYNKIENYAVDVIVLLDAYSNTKIGEVVVDPDSGLEIVFEDTRKSFGTQLAQHCAIVSAKTWECISVIGVEPIKNASLTAIQAYLDELTAPGKNDHFMYNESNFELILNEDGEPMDIGRYLNVVFGPEITQVNEKLGAYLTNGAALYAGLVSTLAPENSTTNKSIPVGGLRYALSEAQHNQLAGGRYVGFEEKIAVNGARRIAIKDGMTAAQAASDYSRLSTVRITHATVQLIRTKSEPFIGLPNGLAQRNSLATEIQAGLDKLKELGVLQQFKFSLFTSAKEKVLGNAFITLELVPQFELRKIYTSVALRASL